MEGGGGGGGGNMSVYISLVIRAQKWYTTNLSKKGRVRVFTPHALPPTSNIIIYQSTHCFIV